MPFPYVYVCDLLEKLDEVARRPLQIATKEKTNLIAIKWLSLHRSRLNEQSVDSQAVIMMLHPEQQIDRNYGLDAERLEQLIARVLNLPRQFYDELQFWRTGTADGDFATCVERVMKTMPVGLVSRATASKVTVEDIDRALLSIATHNPNSSSEIRALASKVNTHDSIELLGRLYRNLGGRESKWLTRLILKDLGPVNFPTHLEISSHNAFLPRCVQMNAEVSIRDACPVLRDGTSLVRGNSSAMTSDNQPNTSLDTTERTVRGTPSSDPMTDQLPTPSTAATGRLRRMYPTSLPPVNQLQTSPPTSTGRVRGRGFSVYSAANQLVTPPTTAPQPSSAPVSNTTRTIHQLPKAREALASLATNVISASQSFSTKSQEQSSSLLLPSVASENTHPTISRATQAVSSHLTASRASNPTFPNSQIGHSKRSAPMKISGSGTCILTISRCPLVNCIFLLSPCISSSPYIVDNLLAWHGCHIVSSVRALSHPSLPRQCPHTGKRYRKIALVEPNRTTQTVDFLKQIEGLNLRRRVKKGCERVEEKQWVEVYDWRLLECVGKLDKGKDSGYNPWRRCWMGAV